MPSSVLRRLVVAAAVIGGWLAVPVAQDLAAADGAEPADADAEGEPAGPRRGGWWQRTFGQ